MKIYVGNLSKETTGPQLRETFEKFGKVTSANILLDEESGNSRGFAFVEMPSAEDAQAAMIGINLKQLAGSTVKVNQAKK